VIKLFLMHQQHLTLTSLQYMKISSLVNLDSSLSGYTWVTLAFQGGSSIAVSLSISIQYQYF